MAERSENDTVVHRTVYMKSILDPYTIKEDDRMSMYSTINTHNVQSMLSGGLDRFYQKYQSLVGKEHLATPEIRFDQLEYIVQCNVTSKDATVGSLFLTPFRKVPTFQKTILHSMNGIIQPKTMTLVLGGPGSGKSTFLKALGGKLKQDKQNNLNGSIEFNGLSANQMELSKLVGLVDQTDDHCPTLTVRETIQFADTCLNGRIEDRPEALQAVASLRTELMLELLGLTNCADTVVGDAMLRGVSGGERKRVTVGEMLVGGQSIFLCDEISTGLDSAATFDIMSSLRSWTKVLGGTAVVALLQPPPEVVELFDDILLLSEGRLVYHGPRTSVLPYFQELGYTCPQRIDPADFLVEVTGGRGYEYRNGNVPDSIISVTPADFAAKFQTSEISVKISKKLGQGFQLASNFEKAEDFQQFKTVANLAHSKRASPFAVPFLPSTQLLIRRQAMLFIRDKAMIYGKLTEALVVGVLLGIIYWNAEATLYLRMLFFAIAIFQRQAWQQITISFQLRSIFYKQRSRNFFRTISYGIANAVVQVPINLVVSILMGSLFYFMSGLVVSVSHFLVFTLILIAFQHAIGAFFTMIAAASPSITVAQALAGIAVCFFLLFSGNIILADLIRPYWIWMYWFDPIAWALRSVMLNEFKSSRYSATESGNILDQFQISQGAEYIWIGIFVLTLYYVFFTCLQTAILHFFRYDHAKGKQGQAAEVVEMEENTIASVDMPNQYDTCQSNEADFIPAYLCISNLEYFVPNPTKGEKDLQLLHGITATFKPKVMTALMGSSGAGKSTLMDVIAGRKTGGTIKGSITVNGEPKDPTTFSRVAAYCEQMDIHSASTTVREALLFSAHLRLPATTSLQTKLDLVQDTLNLLELDSLADSMIGSMASGGLSIEQRKRVTIAVELVANPSILFLDEPTSGLDARAALVVMRGVRSIADTGRTVICTIHQPSLQIFSLFDNLLLLQRGGFTAYCGPLGQDSEHLLNYFDRIPGTDKIEPQYNPATYMLEVIGAGIGRGDGQVTNYADEYQKSELCLMNEEETNEFSSPTHGSFQPLPKYTTFATGLSTQMYYTIIRACKTYWRSPSYNFVRIILYPLFAFIFGTTFYQLGRGSEAKVNSQIALIYNSMDFIGLINMMTVLDITCAERAVYYRERSANMYSPFPYSFALFIAELPYLTLVSGFFVVVEYFLVGWQQEVDSFGFFWFTFFLYISTCTFIGQWMCALMPNAKVANVAVGALSCFLNLFSGYLLPFNQMRSFYKWIIYIMPSSYSLNALVTSQMGLCQDGKGNGCEALTGTDKTVAQYVADTYGFDPDDRYVGMLILMIMWFIIQVAIYLTFRYVNHLKR